MKKVIALICIFLLSNQLMAQNTNKLDLTGNVGIGTTNPTVGKLQLESAADGALMMGVTVNGNGRLYMGTDGSGNTYLRSHNGVDLRFGINGADLLTLKNGGNFGIGTTAPTSRLTITDGVAPYSANESVFLDIKRNNTNGSNTASAVGLRLANNSNGFLIYYGGTTDRLRFLDGGSNEVMSMAGGGNIGIGNTAPVEKLDVNGNARINGNGNFNGTVIAKKIQVSQSAWADYVFDDHYPLKSVSSLESFIKKNKHLPGMPSAKQVSVDGIDIGETQVLLLKKIEELTLYIIEMKKEIVQLKNRRK